MITHASRGGECTAADYPRRARRPFRQQRGVKWSSSPRNHQVDACDTEDFADSIQADLSETPDIERLVSIDHAFEEAAEKVGRRVSMDPRVLRGVPCVVGTRIPVYAIVELLEEGFSHQRILKWFPSLSKDDLQAAIRFVTLVMER